MINPPNQSRVLPVAATGRSNRRLERERLTLEAMMRIYCRDHHGDGQQFCRECTELLAYANQRLKQCRFGANKPTCAKCPVHCYQRDRREQIKMVMRYAGPQMIWRHAILSLWHFLDGFRKVNGTMKKSGSASGT
jgi:exonuclease VII small subunit